MQTDDLQTLIEKIQRQYFTKRPGFEAFELASLVQIPGNNFEDQRLKESPLVARASPPVETTSQRKQTVSCWSWWRSRESNKVVAIKGNSEY